MVPERVSTAGAEFTRVDWDSAIGQTPGKALEGLRRLAV